MKSLPRFGVALVGCGHVASRYVEQIRGYRGVELIGVAGGKTGGAAEFARQYGLKAYDSVARLLADPTVAIVVNLTPPAAHAAVTQRCLKAGKHVYSEKPLALTSGAARRLVDLARRKRLRLGSAPCTVLGEAHQTAWRMIRRGRLGRVRIVFAEVNHGRIERYHPRPQAIFRAGVLWDVAVYPLTVLTTFFGPVCRATGAARRVFPHRTTLSGQEFAIGAPDFVVAVLDFAAGPVVRLTANFCVERGTSKGGGSIEYHGDQGRLFTQDFQDFDAVTNWGAIGQSYRPVQPIRPAFRGAEYGRGVEELADALRQGRSHRASAEQAAHVVEVIEAIQRSTRLSGKNVAVNSTFPPPAPMAWAQ